MYESLDLQTPQLLSGLGLILGIAGLAVLAHSMWRRMRYRANAAGKSNAFEGEDARWDGPQGPVDAAREAFAGIALTVIGVVMIVIAMVLGAGNDDAIDANVQTKYDQVVDVEPVRWRGYQLEANVTLQDGTVHEGVQISFSDDGEPSISGEWDGLTE